LAKSRIAALSRESAASPTERAVDLSFRAVTRNLFFPADASSRPKARDSRWKTNFIDMLIFLLIPPRPCDKLRPAC
jgi:hypothetical protein